MSIEAIQFMQGPLVSEMSRDAVEEGLRHHPKIAKGAAYALSTVEGRYVAAVAVESASNEGLFGGPADQSEESPGPKSIGPDDTTPDLDDGSENGPDSPEDAEPEPLDDGGEDKDGEGDEGDKKESKEDRILKLLDAISTALGITPPGDGPDDGAGDDLGVAPLGPGGPDNLPPPPPPGGPSAGSHGDPSNEQRIIHEKALKPGEVPPGGTPVGAPAFSHVREDHPWKRTAGVVASFSTEAPIGNRPLSAVYSELVGLTDEIGGGYKVKKFEEGTDSNGNRVARALISIH